MHRNDERHTPPSRTQQPQLTESFLRLTTKHFFFVPKSSKYVLSRIQTQTKFKAMGAYGDHGCMALDDSAHARALFAVLQRKRENKLISL